MGTLYLVSTPIGNMEDITIRAVRILTTTQYIACEDTRRAGMLFTEIGKRYPNLASSYQPPTESTKYIRFDDHTEFAKLPEIINLLESGNDIALISDAGTPLISDPGFKLVSECRKRNIPVVSIPGASAVITALTSSGIPTNRFTFLGYPPEKESHNLKLLNEIKLSDQQIKSVYIFYCSPVKLERFFQNLKEVFGDISITVARELTKIHEEVWTGKISAALIRSADFKGEIVICLKLDA
jgi:16S rRNA (cytidine1402-2'-O)-methyltransferase